MVFVKIWFAYIVLAMRYFNLGQICQNSEGIIISFTCALFYYELKNAVSANQSVRYMELYYKTL